MLRVLCLSSLRKLLNQEKLNLNYYYILKRKHRNLTINYSNLQLHRHLCNEDEVDVEDVTSTKISN